jgi:hypothetical protein
MPYVQRNSDGAISAISREPQAGFTEQLADDHPDVQAFVSNLGASEIASTDLEFVRVLEDLLDVLMAKNVLMFTELPAEAQTKILQRQALRRGDNALDLIDDELDI